MKGISNLVINMYRESAKFEYKGKKYQRTVALTKSDNGEYISGYLLKHYAINVHFVYDVKLDILQMFSFKRGETLKNDRYTRNLFVAVKQVIHRFIAKSLKRAA